MSQRVYNNQQAFEHPTGEDLKEFNDFFVPFSNAPAQNVQIVQPEEFLSDNELNRIIDEVDDGEEEYDEIQEIFNEFDGVVDHGEGYEEDLENTHQFSEDELASVEIPQQHPHHQNGIHVDMNADLIQNAIYEDANGYFGAPEEFQNHYDDDLPQPQNHQLQVFDVDVVNDIAPEHLIQQENRDYVIMDGDLIHEPLYEDVNDNFDVLDEFHDDYYDEEPQHFQNVQIVEPEFDNHHQYVQECQENHTPVLQHQFNIPSYDIGIGYLQHPTEPKKARKTKKQPVPLGNDLKPEFVETPAARHANQLLDQRPTVDINTEKLVIDLLACLKTSGIDKTGFGRRILNKSQGHMSSMLARPPPFNAMKKGQEQFIRMHNWIHLTEEERMAIWNLELHPVKEKMAPGNRGKVRLNDVVCEYLKEKLKMNRHPSREEKEQYALELGLNYNTVENWIKKNRKNYWK